MLTCFSRISWFIRQQIHPLPRGPNMGKIFNSYFQKWKLTLKEQLLPCRREIVNLKYFLKAAGISDTIQIINLNQDLSPQLLPTLEGQNKGYIFSQWKVAQESHLYISTG